MPIATAGRPPGSATRCGSGRWLGIRNSTPAFKACLVLLAAVAFALIAYTQVPMP